MLPDSHNKGGALARLQSMLDRGECVILDGANATELQREGIEGFRLSDAAHWGFDALENQPDAVRGVHTSYVEAGSNIITTNSYAVIDAPMRASSHDSHRQAPLDWMELAGISIDIAREATASATADVPCAVAFSIGGDIETESQLETVELLLRVFERHRPDLILFESLSLIEENFTLKAIELLINSGWPVWTSFRRCRDGVCGIYGQLWGGPEGDYFGRLARKLERLGVSALLINCLPLERVPGTISWLRNYTALPLGVYPNLGRLVEKGWHFDDTVVPEEFAKEGRNWRAEGAQIIGGCCGVGPSEIASLVGATKSDPLIDPKTATHATTSRKSAVAAAEPQHWEDPRGRSLFPLPMPEIVVEPDVFIPTQGSYLVWKHLFNHQIGADKQCIDVGCGAGILSVQLARNGARQVVALDIDKAAVANTLTNAFRNDVADRVTGQVADLYAFTPDNPFDVVVASLYQMPTDPRGQLSAHRPVDYWGRNIFDHFLEMLPSLMADNGTAYVMQISLVGQGRTDSILRDLGFTCRVVDFNLYNFSDVFLDNHDQIQRVAEESDAFYFSFREQDVMAMYLLEIRRE